MEKPFEVGEWVFDKRRWAWCRVLESLREHDGRQYGLVVDGWPERSSVLDFTRNPIIPPKPKRMVTKEAAYHGMSWNPGSNECTVSFTIPMGHIRRGFPEQPDKLCCTYEIEE